MRGFFARPFVHYEDPFFISRFATPPLAIRWREEPQEELRPRAFDPHDTFDKFFDEHDPIEEEREFFRKHFPERMEEEFDPYKVLGVDQDASLEQVKEAYRRMAIKFHPKNSPGPEAEQKFADIAKAYEIILESKKRKESRSLGFNSFFEDFEKEMDSLWKVDKKSSQMEAEKKEEKPEEGKEENLGALYSESSSYESVNGQQTKLQVEKVYKKDGKVLKVNREEKLNDDGKMEITETIDDGKDVKKKSYIKANTTKALK